MIHRSKLVLLRAEAERGAVDLLEAVLEDQALGVSEPRPDLGEVDDDVVALRDAEADARGRDRARQSVLNASNASRPVVGSNSLSPNTSGMSHSGKLGRCSPVDSSPVSYWLRTTGGPDQALVGVLGGVVAAVVVVPQEPSFSGMLPSG